MKRSDNSLVQRKRNSFSKDGSICCDSFSCQDVYETGVSLSWLYMYDVLEVSVVVAGSGVCCALDQVIPCSVGDIYIFPADIPHRFFLNGDKQPLKLRRLFIDIRDWFEGDIAYQGHPKYMYGLFNDNAVMAYAMLNANVLQQTEQLLSAIDVEVSEQQDEWHDIVQAYLVQLLVLISRYINGAIKNIPPETSKERELVLSVIRKVKESYADHSLTLEMIASLLYVSKSHLSKQFKRFTGESFSDYLRAFRLDNACRLLRETTMTVTEIVASCGLRDVTSFYHNFNACFGMTPNEYRIMTRESVSSEEKGKEEIIMDILNDISLNLQQGRARKVKELVQQAIDAGCNPVDILNEGLLQGMSVIGEKFKNNEVFVPEVLVAARAMNMGSQLLKPYLAEADAKAIGKACIGTVQGDLHDIGKNLVRMMLEGKGLEVVDLGVDVPPEKFVSTAIEQECQIICCSALLTTTMGIMRDVVKAAEEAGIRDKVKIMIGGAPVTEEFCHEIGADCYTADAASAADAAAAFCKEQ